jgi:hypothetical protein
VASEERRWNAAAEEDSAAAGEWLRRQGFDDVPMEPRYGRKYQK